VEQEPTADDDGAVIVWPSIPESIPRAPYDLENWHSELGEHSRDLLCTHDLEGRLLSINAAPARILGYSVLELLQMPMREMVVPEFRHEFDNYLLRIASTGAATGLLMVATRTGERRIWHYHNALHLKGADTPVVHGIAHDITAQQQAHQLLYEINERLSRAAHERERATLESQSFRTLLDHSNDAIELLDRDTLRFLDVNATACRALGYSREELLGMSVFDIVPTLTPELRNRNQQIMLTAGSVALEAVHRRKDGSEFPVEVTLKSVTLDRAYVVAIARDITDRKRVELELRSRELHFRTVFEQASDGIFISDRDGKYLDVNSAGAKMLGYSREEILRLSIADVVTREETPRIRPETSRLQGDIVIRGEWQFLRKDGSVFPGEVTGRRLPDGRLQGFVRDISERRQAEEELRVAMEELRQAKEKLSEEKLYLEEAIDTEMGFGEIIGQSKALKAVLAHVITVAASDATVLIEGETGTGKELIARALHRISSRSNNTFIKVNCAAIPSGLLESELFGHEKGAFTGAIERKLGRLELADRGTLFLDEIGEIPLELQPKLLRVLQDHEFERLGSTRTVKVDFRLIVATNRDLSESVKRGAFRRDLYYRLRVFPVRVPPLRERREDIPLLVEHFVQKYASRMKRCITSIPKKTMDALAQWDWPGNIRELENFVERSVIVTEGSVLRAPLGEFASSMATQPDRTLDATQREHILKVLRECGGRIGGITGAAARLGLKRTTLQSKLKQLGIGPGEWRKT
jgi:PAS domain S-box-containing protein